MSRRPIDVDGEEFKWYSQSNNLEAIFSDAKILVERGIDIFVRKEFLNDEYTGAYELFTGG